MTRKEFRSLDSPETAREAIESLSLETGVTEVPLLDAHDRLLAERVDAPLDVPGFDRAAMDGYALRARDTFEASGSDPETLPVLGRVYAGSEPDVALDGSGAIEIATGAVLPKGTDAVVPVEQTTERDDEVDIGTAVTPGENVMFQGADIASGDRALGPGTRLGSRHIGLLAALGQETVTVQSRPQVGIVSTGAELVQPGDELDHGAGQIYDVNSHSIASAVQAAGGDPKLYQSTADNRPTMEAVLSRAAEECGLLLTSGSTSAGSSDLLYQLLEETGKKLVHGVSIKPGRPLLVGRLFDTPYVGLPGYPVSALMTFTHFVAPRLRSVTTGSDTTGDQPGTAHVDAELRTRVRYDGGRLRLLAIGLVGDGDGGLVGYAPTKGSGATTTLADTDGFIRMAPETSLLDVGTEITVERFDANDPIPSLLGVGDPDPVLFSLLDDLSMPRHLRFGEADARRWFDDGVPDVLVTVGTETDQESADERDPAPTTGEELACWRREWGLVVPSGNPDGVDGIESLAAGDLQFANLDSDISLRESLDGLLDSMDHSAADIAGYHRELPGLESAARSVAGGTAEAGLGIAQSAAKLDCDFVRLGTQTVCVIVSPDRRDKFGVETLAECLDSQLSNVLDNTAGYRPASTDPSE